MYDGKKMTFFCSSGAIKTRTGDFMFFFQTYLTSLRRSGKDVQMLLLRLARPSLQLHVNTCMDTTIPCACIIPALNGRHYLCPAMYCRLLVNSKTTTSRDQQNLCFDNSRPQMIISRYYATQHHPNTTFSGIREPGRTSVTDR